MPFNYRTLFPYFALALVAGSVLWAISFGTIPPADFTFVNGTEIKTVDPAIVTGAPEGRIIYALFEGIYGVDPKTAEPVPGMCTTVEGSTTDNQHYTFPLRKNAVWTDGSPVTAHDFVWSWRRFLHPETASEYAYQLWYVRGAEDFTKRKIKLGQRVEVELNNRPQQDQLFPSGDFVKGTLEAVKGHDQPKTDKDGYVVDRPENVYVVRDDAGKLHRFQKGSTAGHPELARQILPEFGTEVGIRAPDDYNVQVDLKAPTPFFRKLMSFYPLYPVNRKCVETYGYPLWTKPENIVTNGPFRLKFRRIRDRIRLVKNPTYWNAEHVSLNVIDALAVQSDTTQLNMYLNGQVDWIITVPTSVIDQLKKRDDYLAKEMLASYFYRINTTKPPLDNPLVRRALNMAMDKQEIVEYVTRAGQTPARSFVPPGIKGYDNPPLCGPFDPEAARKLLAEAGYPGGKGMPPIEILYNTSEGHQRIAEKIQDQWSKHLNIEVHLVNQEWAVFLSSTRKLEYNVARAGWIGDYTDPNTFLDMFVTDGENNQTGWSNAEYDRLIDAAKYERDPAKRMEIFRQAEQILMDEQPIIPIYHYVVINMVRPWVKGFHHNIQDVHPLEALSVDKAMRDRILKTKGLR